MVSGMTYTHSEHLWRRKKRAHRGPAKRLMLSVSISLSSPLLDRARGRVGKGDEPVCRKCERRVPGDLPGKTVRIGKVAGIAAPDRCLGRLEEARPCGKGL